jgi:hypothetical protein
MSARQDALVEVVDIIRRHGLTLDDISAALKGGGEFHAQKSGGILMRLFGYLGGLFVFAGLATFVAMQWEDLNSAGRIMVTLGTGFSIFILALVCTTDARLERAATPLFLVSALLQPSGILVMLKEFSRGGDPAHGALFMTFVMAVQQGCTFWAKDRTVLAFTTLFFGCSFFAIAFDLMKLDPDLIGAVIGLSLVCIGWSLNKSKHKALAGVTWFFGSFFFLAAAYDTLRKSPFEILFLGLSCGTIFLSTVARSRTLLVVGTLATLGYICYFIDKHFHNSLAGPIGLMVVGFLLIGMGVLAVKINNKYIKQKG